MLIALAMLAATWVGAGSPLLFLGAGVQLVAFLGLWSADRTSRGVHSVTPDIDRRFWTWWTTLGATLAAGYVAAAAAQMASDPKPTNLGAFALMVGFAGLATLGLTLRSHSYKVGSWMVIIAMVPALLFIWLIVPPLVGIAVICGATIEIAKDRS